jgi:hypothetical protein
MTEYLGLAVEHMRAQGRLVDETLLTHISPAQSEPIGLVGTITITVDIDAELAQLDPTGHRRCASYPWTWRSGDRGWCSARAGVANSNSASSSSTASTRLA